MAVRVSWDQALAWRLKRQMLDPAPALSADEVVRRLGGVQAQVASSAELAIRVRQARSAAGRGCRGPPGRAADQDLGDARHAPPARARRGRLVPVAPRQRSDLGAAELAALLRDDPAALGAAAAGGPRGARRRGPHPRGAHRRGHDRPRPRAHRRLASLRMGNAAQAPGLAGRPRVRPEPGQPSDVHPARGGKRGVDRHPRSGRRRTEGDRPVPRRLRSGHRRRVR